MKRFRWVQSGNYHGIRPLEWLVETPGTDLSEKPPLQCARGIVMGIVDGNAHGNDHGNAKKNVHQKR